MHYPNVEQFNARNFAYCPILIIEKALDIIHENQLKEANLNAVPIANSGILNLQAQGIKKKPKGDWINPFPKLIERHEYRDFLDKETIETFKELYQKQKLSSFIFREYGDIVKILESQF